MADVTYRFAGIPDGVVASVYAATDLATSLGSVTGTQAGYADTDLPVGDYVAVFSNGGYQHQVAGDLAAPTDVDYARSSTGGGGTSVAPADLAKAEYRSLMEDLNGSDQFTWTYNNGGDPENPPMDLTDPKNPTVIEAGLYCFSVTVQNVDVHADARFRLILSLDDAGFGWIAQQSMTLEALDCLNVSSTIYLPAGAYVTGYTSHNVGEAARFSTHVTVQRIL